MATLQSADIAQTLTFNVGPHHSAAIGPLRVQLHADGEVVVTGEPEVGYLHRGIEKIAERMTWTGFLPFTDRIDYLAAVHCNLAYSLAVEKLAGVAVSDRASAVRVIVGELNRIGSHLLSVGSLAQCLGSETALFYAVRDREKINNLFELLCGARLTYSCVRIGGISSDVTEGFVEKTYEFIDYLIPKLEEYHHLLSNNLIFEGRLKCSGQLVKEVAIAHGLSGPNLRATGLNFDTRKNSPYCGYQKYNFEVVVGQNGDSFDRYLVRMKEIEQSASIIRQALDALPDGPTLTPLPRIFKVPRGEAYASVEGPRGSFGVYIVSDGEKYPQRVRFRTPSFATLNLFPKVLENVPLSDVASIISSLDIMVSEVDR